LEFNLKNLQSQSNKQSLEEQLIDLEKQLRNAGNREEVFLDYFEQFVNLLLIKHLSIKDKQEYQLTEKEKKEREILDKIVASWFYKTSCQ